MRNIAVCAVQSGYTGKNHIKISGKYLYFSLKFPHDFSLCTWCSARALCSMYWVVNKISVCLLVTLCVVWFYLTNHLQLIICLNITPGIDSTIHIYSGSALCNNEENFFKVIFLVNGSVAFCLKYATLPSRAFKLNIDIISARFCWVVQHL